MRTALGYVLMCLMLNLAATGANLPCGSGRMSSGRGSDNSMTGSSHAAERDGMADMAGSHGRDSGKPCPMPVLQSCCQALPSCETRANESAAGLIADNPPTAPAAIMISRSVAPDTPPPKA